MTPETTISEEEKVYAGMAATAVTALIGKMLTNLVYDWVFIMCVRPKPNLDLSRFPFG
jgi:hypothetical protein